MGNIIAWFSRNFVYLLMAGMVAGSAFVVWKIDHATFALKEATAENAKLAKQVDAARKAVVAVMAESQVEKERVIRVEREVRYVEAMPTSVTCGEPVHAAIDLMRDHKSGNPK